MAALDFPASSVSPWTAPNGVIYTWNTDGYWEAKADPKDFDTEYLKLNATNDPVTGNLDLDQDLAVNGSADFNSGNLQIREFGDKSVISLRKDGQNQVHFGATDTAGVIGIDYRSSNFTAGTEVIKLNGDTGSGSFAGEVTSEKCVRGHAEGNGGAGFRGYYSDDTICTSLGRQLSSPSGEAQSNFYDKSGNATITFSHEDGNAEFVGEIRAKELVVKNPGVSTHTLRDEGVALYTTDADADAKALRIRSDNGGSAVEQCVVYGNGDAYFRGNATLAGPKGIVFNLEPDNDANYTVTTEEYEEQEEVTPYIPAVEAVYGEPPLITPAVDPVVGPLGNVLVEGTEAIYGEAPLISEAVPAVEATYQTVTKTREIRTYTGPTLDVKEAIQELQQRVADRDEVITQLTTRIAELESATGGGSDFEARIAALETDMARFKAI